MTREKNEPEKRKVIVDMSYPDGGVNALIYKNQFNGNPAQHTLPTIASAVDMINKMGREAIVAAVLDLKLEFHRENRTHRAASGRKT